MTKERARQRAKTNALKKKAKKLKANTDDAGQQTQAEPFSSGGQTIKGPGGNNRGNTFGGARRGASRSK
ncbi:hypothetical protein V5T82_05395 [Magnetovibrio sp. PR-2]|uniref:hypothetical protein n=1 Tax=Magnetovibrio sp. PR-2 TaxID=3120356 RepID=UPI002FCE50B0